MSPAEVENLIERAEQRIQLVRAEQHGQAEFPLQTADKLDHGTLVAGVQADQRLVKEQETRAPEQGLREEQSLALAAGHLAKGAPSEVGRTDEAKHPLHVAPPGGVKDRQAPPMPVDSRCNKIPSAQSSGGGDTPGLRHVTDRSVSAGNRCTQDVDDPGGWTEQAEDRAHHRRLPGAVRSEHADERVFGDGKIHLRKDLATAQSERDVMKRDCVQGAGFANAASSASSCAVIQV